MVKNNSADEIHKFFNYLLIDKHNTTYKCPTPNCEYIICNICYNNVKTLNEENKEYSQYNVPSKYSIFMCPYCRTKDWKDYYTNVLNDLVIKVQGQKEFDKSFINKCLSELDNKLNTTNN